LGLNGKRGLQYSELALLNSLTLLVLMFVVKRGINELKAEIQTTEEISGSDENIDEKVKNYEILKKVYKLK